MSRTATWLTSVSFLLAAGCHSAPEIADQRPDFVPRTHTTSTVSVLNSKSPGSFSFGSAVILDDTHLVTNLHVWSDTDSYWDNAPPPKRELGILYSNAGTYAESNGREPTFEQFQIAACPPVQPKALVEHDWVVISTTAPGWHPDEAALIHPPATDPDWRVSPGTELYLIGYSAIFFDNNSTTSDTIDTKEQFEDRIVRWWRFCLAGPYVVCGKATSIDIEEQVDFGGESRTAVTYPKDWPRPGGHSGGGVYLWNTDEEQLELVGVLSTHTKMSGVSIVASTYELGPFSLTARNHIKDVVQSVSYVPIGTILAAMEQEAN